MDTNRFVLPRWRASVDHVLSVEAEHVSDLALDTSRFDAEFEAAIAAHEEDPSPGSVADLLATALVLGRNEEVAALAFEVVEGSFDVGPGPMLVARAILDRLDKTLPLDLMATSSASDYFTQLRTLRAALRRDPRNSVAWMDSALVYTILGQKIHAQKAVEIALSLSPENRFVLRSASRFFLHIGEADRAHLVLHAGPRVEDDPWLAAASISTALVAGAPPLRDRAVKRLLERTAPAHATELWSSFAMVDYVEGRERRALSSFRESLVDPTENSLAQAEWVSGRTAALEVDENLLDEVRFPHEARSRHWVQLGKAKEALWEAERWMDFQPFSAEAAAFASYVASVGLRDFEKAAELARRRLRVGGGNQHWLLNNLAFALANDGRIEEAKLALSKVPAEELEMEPHLVATQGLIQFRSGFREEGRELYRRALRMARQSLGPDTQALMAIFWAREEARLEDSDPTVRQVALELANRTDNPLVESWLPELGKIAQRLTEP